MRKLLALGLGLALAASLTVSAFAGPSHAIVQELGAVVPAGEVNADLYVINLNTAGAVAGTSVGGGNGTIGSAAIADVNVGLGNGFEVRTGALPGLGSKINGVSTANGLTVKYAGFVPGLAVYGAYGSASNALLGTGAGTTTSATRFGGAYTAPVAGWVLNANADFGSNVVGATTTNVTDIGVAALYPLTSNILVGGEYLNTSLATGASTITVSGFGLGGRIIAGNFTVDALVYANVSVSATGVATNGNTAQLGYPVALNVNYKF